MVALVANLTMINVVRCGHYCVRAVVEARSKNEVKHFLHPSRGIGVVLTHGYFVTTFHAKKMM